MIEEDTPDKQDDPIEKVLDGFEKPTLEAMFLIRISFVKDIRSAVRNCGKKSKVFSSLLEAFLISILRKMT